MNIEKLIHMANQIASFFRSYPEGKALAGIRDHLVSFWTPGMRNTIQAHAQQGGKGLDPLVIKALQTAQASESPIEKGVAGPETIGQLGSDAG